MNRFLKNILPGALMLAWATAWAQPAVSVSQAGVRTKEYSWGVVKTTHLTDGLQLLINVTPSQVSGTEVRDLDKQAGSGQIALQRALFVAIPPDVNVRVSLATVKSQSVDPSVLVASSQFFHSTDSSILVPGQLTLAEAARGIPSVVLSPGGYEWFRGYRLFRLDVSCLRVNGGSVEIVEEVQARLSYEQRRESVEQRGSSSDPQFDGVFRELVVNPEDLKSIATAPLAWTDTSGGWFQKGRTYVKLAIPQDGIYRITYDDLQSSVTGMGSVQPATLRVFNYGKEIPAVVSTQRENSFSSGDYIEFTGKRNYGDEQYRRTPSGTEPNPLYLNRYTDTSYYWLTWGGENGLRLQSNAGIAGGTDTLDWYTEQVHIEKDNALQFADGNNLLTRQDPRWLPGDIWGSEWLFANGAVASSFTATDIASGADSVRLYARFSSVTWPGTKPNYKVRLRLNSSDTLQKIDDSGTSPHVVMRGSAQTSSLVEGRNTVFVHSLPASGTVNAIWFDWAEAEYPRKLKATGDSLLFSFPAVATTKIRIVRVSGLTTPNVVIHKLGAIPKRISAFTTSAAAPYSITFADTVTPGDRYIVLSGAKVLKPIVRSVKAFKGLRDATRGADHLLITHSRFLPIAGSYSSLIGATYSLRTLVLDVADLFDEFGYGYPTAESIKEFLRATTKWQAPMPSYVLLAGDATYDYKYIVRGATTYNQGNNYVPSYGHPSSDPWFAVLDDSSIVPQMYVGRIPVSSEDEFSRYLQHLQSYVKTGNDDWNKRYLFFAGGDPNAPGEIETLKSIHNQIVTTMVQPAPVGGNAGNFYKTTNPPTDFGPYTPAAVKQAIDNGGVFISYLGHSGTQTWDNGIGAPSQLQNNRGRYSLVTDFGCSTAKFAEPDIRCFGELFTLDPAGSAIAYIGNSSLGFTSISTSLPQLFYRKLLIDGIPGLGKAHLMAKLQQMQTSGGLSSGLSRVMMLANVLLGEPALEIAIPQKPNLAISNADLTTTPRLPTDDDEMIKVTLPYANTGKVLADSLTVTVSRIYNNVRRDTTIARRIPLFQDTVTVSYPVKDSPGEHTFRIALNSDRHIDELRSDDNNASLQSFVASNAFKMISPLVGFEQPVRELVFMNPMKAASGDSRTVALEIDTLGTFSNPLRFQQNLGQVVTRIPMRSLRPDAVHFWRAQLQNSSRPWSEGNFVTSSQPGTLWQPRDSSIWSQNTFTDARYTSGAGVSLKDRVINVRTTSSGFVDGSFGAVEIDGVNILPYTFARGHTVVLMDSVTLAVKAIQSFDTYGEAGAVSRLSQFIADAPLGQIVIDLIIDEGAQGLSQIARNALKTIGSKYIDSVAFRDSWAIIGRKGAGPGTVPELWKRQYAGRVIIDTTFIRKVQQGSVLSKEIGPAGGWLQASFSGVQTQGTSLTGTILGVRRDGSLDTLMRNLPTGTVSLSSVSASVYPKLRLLSTLLANAQGGSPILTDWTVSVLPPAELAVNYQSVRLSADTVLEGEPVEITCTVFNVGGRRVDSLSIAILDLQDGRGVLAIDTVFVPYIPADSSGSFSRLFQTQGRRGANTLIIQVDPNDRITEIYRSNNVYSAQIVVRADTTKPTVAMTFDGQHVFDGDYVSARPTIVARIFDSSPLPISDASNLSLLIDGRRIALGTSPDSLFEMRTGDEKVRITVRPTLQKGEHSLALFVHDASGNLADTLASRVRFRVESESKLLNVFNYPNPFSSETCFTYNITGSTLPDDITIKVFTVAGRLIQEIRVPVSDIRFGFNRVPWDGRDRDGDEIANGVYLYRIALRVGEKMDAVLGKLAKVR